ncbi:MAG: hypothetical protein K0U38_03455, partial [Epsilonproteobacteria bacterium]|nr:hypothetical protein [Campylobacterota bacterium]
MTLRSLLLTTVVLFLASCGGGEHEPREEKTLYFVDSAVNGIDYKCGERKGVSKTIAKDGVPKHGAITCVYAPLELSLGSLALGSVESFSDGQIIRPQDLVPSFDGDFKNKALLKIAILLQSLDDKQSSDHITIAESLKEQIEIERLSDVTMSGLNQEIQKLGMTPVAQDEAMVHLIMHSENTNIGKPTIKPFEEDISTSLSIGSTIGKLSIGAGDGTLNYPLVLEGEGKDNFLLNNNGSLTLIKSLDSSAIYELNVTVSNEYGYTTQPISIYVKESSKIAKAQMGRLLGATVNIIKLNSDGTQDTIYSTTTNSEGSLNRVGNFELKDEMLEDDAFYIYEVSGGQDIDTDDNGIADANSSKNSGKLRLLTKGIWVKNAMHKVRVTPLSELLYSYVEQFSYAELEVKLNEYAKILLKTSLDGDSTVDVKDVMIFDPLNNQDALYDTLVYNDTYRTLVNKIRDAEVYRDDLLNAYIVESFAANAIEIVGSSIYTIDMLGSGEFAIYDLETKKKIGSLKLPYAPFSEDSHVIYINLLDNQVRVNSLVDWSYEINIKNQKNPIL